MKTRRIIGIVLLSAALLAGLAVCLVTALDETQKTIGIIGGADAPTFLFLLQNGLHGRLPVLCLCTGLAAAAGIGLILSSRQRTRKEPPHDSKT